MDIKCQVIANIMFTNAVLFDVVVDVMTILVCIDRLDSVLVVAIIVLLSELTNMFYMMNQDQNSPLVQAKARLLPCFVWPLHP